MKKEKYFLLLICTLFFTLQSFAIMGVFTVEKQKYEVVFKGKGFEIRHYPSVILATVYSSAKNYKELASPGFRKIAGYIFGNNESKTKIAMTAPVHMDMNSDVSSMSFVMPSEYGINNLPKPNSPDVKIQQTASEYVAVIAFGGYANDNSIKEQSEKLNTLLLENKIKVIGKFRFLGYNAPYQFIGRKNEVIVTVDWKQ
jgi:hypothetical protein